MVSQNKQFTAIVPAAGVGKRMQADRPKQYLKIGEKTVLEHTLEKLISHSNIDHIVLVLHPNDPYFEALPCFQAPWLTRVDGGKERADSVLCGLNALSQQNQDQWVLVHDAARPCVRHTDIDKLLALASNNNAGGILAAPVRDTMKRSHSSSPELVTNTVEREGLWHALTPQCFELAQLHQALSNALNSRVPITDEASAIEWAGGAVTLIESSDKNIKITRPDDLALAAFYLSQEN